jgi:hypothetical protein
LLRKRGSALELVREQNALIYVVNVKKLEIKFVFMSNRKVIIPTTYAYSLQICTYIIIYIAVHVSASVNHLQGDSDTKEFV